MIGSLGFVIILQLLQLVHFRCHSPILEAPEVKVVNAQKKTVAKVPHIQHHQWHHHRHDGIPQSKPMVQNSNGFGKTKLDIKTGVYTTSQTCDNQQIWLNKILVKWCFHVQKFYFPTFLVALKLSRFQPPQPQPGVPLRRVRSRFVLSKI